VKKTIAAPVANLPEGRQKPCGSRKAIKVPERKSGDEEGGERESDEADLRGTYCGSEVGAPGWAKGVRREKKTGQLL